MDEVFMQDIITFKRIGTNADKLVSLQGKSLEHALQGAGRNEVVVSKYPNILAGGLFITLKNIEVRSAVGFIAHVANIESSLPVILDHRRRIVRGGVVRYDKLDTAFVVNLFEKHAEKLIEVFRPVIRRNSEAEQRATRRLDRLRHRVLVSSNTAVLCHCRRLVTKINVPQPRPMVTARQK